MAVIRRKKNKEALIRRAHLGSIDNPDEMLNLARQNNIQTIPLDVEALAKLLNVKIKYQDDMDKNASGSLKKTEEGWVCYINNTHHKTRQRFTIAHELAHFILHKNKKDEFKDYTYYRKPDNSNIMEFQANTFASMLLMPEAEFRYFYKTLSTQEISEKFGVSQIAAEIRVKQLDVEKQS